MSNIPVLSIRGNTDAERVTEMISYLSSLSSAIDRELLSIDFANLNGDLADRINNSITEHQDLTGYSSKNYTKRIANELQNGINVLDYIIGSWRSYYPHESITEKVETLDQELYNAVVAINELKDAVLKLDERLEKLE